MGCARSKEKQNDIEKKISKRNVQTPKINHHESSIDIVVPETPMSPSSPDTIDIRKDIKKQSNVEPDLSLSQVLERSRRERERFYNSLLSPPSSSEKTNSVNSINDNTLITPIKTTPMIARSSFQTNLIKEEILFFLNKVNDCEFQHRLDKSEFLAVQNHLLGLINTLVSFVQRLNSDKKILFKINYNEIREGIYDMSQSIEHLNSLIELSNKLDILNQSLKDHLNEINFSDDSNSKIFNLLDQLDEINLKFPKENFTCKCMRISSEEYRHDLSFDDSEFNLDVDINKKKPNDTRPALLETINQIDEIITAIDKDLKLEKPIKEDEESLENEDRGSTPASSSIQTPESNQSNISTIDSESTPSNSSLNEFTGTSDEIKLTLNESKSEQPNDSNQINRTNDIKEAIEQVVTEIIVENSTNVNYTDESNFNSSANDLDKESENSTNELTNKVETTEFDTLNNIETQSKTQSKTEQINGNKNKPNKKKKKSKRR